MNYNFNPGLPEPLNRIHPLQLQYVRAFLKRDFPDEVSRIIIFGSSVKLTCHPKSDLDFYVLFEDSSDEETVEKISDDFYLHGKSLGVRCDFLFSYSRDFKRRAETAGNVEYDVINEGVAVYAKT